MKQGGMKARKMNIASKSLLFIPLIGSIFISSCSIAATEIQGRDPFIPPSGYVMKFERTGGYFGWYDAFWIYPDGRVLSSEGKKAKIPSETVLRWMETIQPVEIPIFKKKPSVQTWGRDCYLYRITVYGQCGTSVLSLSCTDIYLPRTHDDAEGMDIGPIRDTLMHLPWK